MLTFRNNNIVVHGFLIWFALKDVANNYVVIWVVYASSASNKTSCYANTAKLGCYKVWHAFTSSILFSIHPTWCYTSTPCIITSSNLTCSSLHFETTTTNRIDTVGACIIWHCWLRSIRRTVWWTSQKCEMQAWQSVLNGNLCVFRLPSYWCVDWFAGAFHL